MTEKNTNQSPASTMVFLNGFFFFIGLVPAHLSADAFVDDARFHELIFVKAVPSIDDDRYPVLREVGRRERFEFVVRRGDNNGMRAFEGFLQTFYVRFLKDIRVVDAE